MSFSLDTYTVCYLACQIRIDHFSGQNCSSRFMRANYRVGSVEITRGSTWIQVRVQCLGS